MSFPPCIPTIQNPYPDKWKEVTEFEYVSDLYLGRGKQAIGLAAGREAEYIVFKEYRCLCKVDGRPWEIVVPSGMLTDLASVPWAARPLVGRVGPHLEAAVVHDFLYVAWQDLRDRGPRATDFRFANDVMFQAMLAANVSCVIRNVIFLAVSSFIARRNYNQPNLGARYVQVAN